MIAYKNVGQQSNLYIEWLCRRRAEFFCYLTMCGLTGFHSYCSAFEGHFDTLLRTCGNLISFPKKVFKVDICEKNFPPPSPATLWEVKIAIPILKNCLVIYERFKRHILCLELNIVEKYDASKEDLRGDYKRKLLSPCIRLISKEK